MSKSLKDYASEVRALREAGRGFSVSDGYKLSGGYSSGQKGAITRAFNSLAEEPASGDEADFDEIGVEYYDDSFPDELEPDFDYEWDDIPWFDFDEYIDADDDADAYSEE